jgi:hypothetical protein
MWIGKELSAREEGEFWSFFCRPLPLNLIRLSPSEIQGRPHARPKGAAQPQIGVPHFQFQIFCSFIPIWGLGTEKSLKTELKAGKCFRKSNCASFPTMADKDRVASRGRTSDLIFQRPQLHPYPYPYLSQAIHPKPAKRSRTRAFKMGVAFISHQSFPPSNLRLLVPAVSI